MRSLRKRTRADYCANVLVHGDEDDFHPLGGAWLDCQYRGRLLHVVRFMHGLFTGALLPKPLLDQMRLRHPIDIDLPDRPWITKGYVSTWR